MRRVISSLSLVLLLAGVPACSLLVDTDPYLGGPRDGGGRDADTGVSPDGPTTPVVRITPASPVAGDALVVEIVTASTDPLSADPVTYEIRWLRGAVDAAISGERVPEGRTRKDEVWTAEVTPVSSDGARRGAPGTASVTIGNTPPTIASIGLDSYRPVVGETMVAFAGRSFDPDGDPVAVRYAWQRNGAVIDGQVANRLDLTRIPVEPGDRISVTATARDTTTEGNTVVAGPAILLSDTTRWRALLPNRVLSMVSFVVFDPPNRRVLFAYPENDDGTGIRLWEYWIDDAAGRFVQLFPTGPEPPLALVSPLYDPRNRRILLFGGQGDLDSGGVTSDVYVLDVSQRGNEAWSLLSPAGAPPSPRSLAAVAFDEARNRVLFYSGINFVTSESYNDLWTLDVTTAGSESWTEHVVPMPPVAVVGPGFAIDMVRDRAVLAGGGDAPSGGGEPAPTFGIYTLALDDMSGGFVTLGSTVPRPVLLPTTGIDAAHDRMLVAYGTAPGGVPNPDAIAIDLETLAASIVAPSGGSSEGGGRGFLVPDPHRDGELVLCPGSSFSERGGGLELYRWGSDDALVPIHRTGIDLPPPLEGAIAVGEWSAMMYGGEDHRERVREEAWTLSSTDQWTRVVTLGDAVSGRFPGPRAGVNLQAGSAFGSDLQFFGGRTDGGGAADGQMWVLRDTRWIEQTLAVGQSPPEGRQGAAFFPPACGGWRSGYFGGLSPSGGFLSDTGFFECRSGDRECSWSDPVETMARPPARAYATAARFNEDSTALIFGGEEGGSVLGDVWTLFTCGGGPQAWQAIAPTGPAPAARTRHSMTLVRTTTPGELETLLVFGGSTSSGGWGTALSDVTRLVRLSSTDFRWETVDVARGPNDDQISPRQGHAAVWDTRAGRLLVYGGANRSRALGDFWELRVRP